MTELRYTLVTDGVSDDALIPALTWLLREQGVGRAIIPAWADFWRLPRRPKGLADKIKKSLELYPCDLLFIHRDAENEPSSRRREEILVALKALGLLDSSPPSVCIIPVRMMEAWLLFDESALRRAAGNPNGRVSLKLPRITEIEQEPDPKGILHRVLRDASELRGRRLKNFPTIGSARQVARYLDSFAPLRGLSAFATLEADIAGVVRDRGWNR